MGEGAGRGFFIFIFFILVFIKINWKKKWESYEWHVTLFNLNFNIFG